jgi:hypothetical protein
MPRAGSRKAAIAKLREQSARARRLAAGMTSETDRRLLNELADKLEAEAEAAEREQDGNDASH